MTDDFDVVLGRCLESLGGGDDVHAMDLTLSCQDM